MKNLKNIDPKDKREVNKVAAESSHWALWVGDDWFFGRQRGVVFEIGSKSGIGTIFGLGVDMILKETPYGKWKQQRMRDMKCTTERGWNKLTKEVKIGETLRTIGQVKVNIVKFHLIKLNEAVFITRCRTLVYLT